MADEFHAGDSGEEKSKTQPEQKASADKAAQDELRRKLAAWPCPLYYKPHPIYIECPKKEEKWCIEWWKTRLEIVSIIAGVVVLIVLWLQYRDMTEATNAAVRQLEEMKRTRNLDERAWVAANWVNGNVNSSTYLAVKFTNTGKTPALNVEPFVGLVFDIKQVPSKDDRPAQPGSSMLLAPESSTSASTASLNLDQVKAWKNGSPACVFGTVWYDDIFGQHHWSQFNYVVHPDGSVEALPIHNGCDDATNQTN